MISVGGLIRSLTFAYNMSASFRIIIGLTFLTFVGSGEELTSKKVFTTMALVFSVHRTSVTFLSRALFYLSEGFVSTKRMQVSAIIMCKQ